MRILLTNDDSHESPLLLAALDHLRRLGEVTVVVPAHEQSGTGKSVTIPRPLKLDTIEIGGQGCFTIDGTPADCAQIGIHHLMDPAPDLVVSGINMGRNSGIPFLLWSGTVGAAFESALQGIPAIALSQDLGPETWSEWLTYRTLKPSILDPLLEQTHRLLDPLFETIFTHAEYNTRPAVWNANLPSTAAPDCSIVLCQPGAPRYGSCFRRDGESGFRFGLREVEEDTDADSTGPIVQRGHIALNHLTLHDLWARPATILRTL